MKIALVIASLGGGGAERVISRLANAWVREGVEVELITLADVGTDAYPLDPAVRRIGLGLTGTSRNLLQGLFANARRVRALRRAIVAARPDVVISFLTTTNLLAVLACAGLRCPVILSERIFLETSPPAGIWKFLFRPLYRRAAAVVAQTRRGAAALQARLQRSVAVIANPVVLQAEDEGMPVESLRIENRRVVLAAGRLVPQKGFDLLIEAFARVAAEYPAWNLCILGEGPLRSALTAQAAALGVGTRVRLPGHVAHPQAWMRRADLFVLSSRFEGLPNVLLEAMAHGMPCISFDCASGPAELIEHGVDGWLLPSEDVGALATAMRALMADEALRHRLGSAAAKITQRYAMDAVLAQWHALIASVLPCTGSAHRGRAAAADAGISSRGRS
jgi:glycosyltransferase involved in cell wall biosynthesis